MAILYSRRVWLWGVPVALVASCTGGVAGDHSGTKATANRSPVAVEDTYQGEQEQPLDIEPTLGVLANDIDRDGDTLICALDSPPTNGTLTLAADGAFSYQPDATFFGTDTFTYRASDGTVESAAAKVTLLINAAGNVPPLATDDTAVVHATGSGSIDVLANDSDADNDTLEIISVAAPSAGTATHDGQTVVYAAVGGASGTQTFEYTITDGRGGQATATVTVTISANAAPVATPLSPITLNEDGSTQLSLTGTDREDAMSTLQIIVTVPPAMGRLSAASGTAPLAITYTPDENYFGTESLTFTATDTQGAESAPVVVSISVTAIDDLPIAVDDYVFIEAGQVRTIYVLSNDSDADGETLTVMSVTQGSAGSVTTDGTVVTYTSGGASGADSFTYTMGDGNTLSPPATVHISVVSTEWFSLGDSAFSPWSTHAHWGSAASGGVSGNRFDSQYPRVAIDSNHRPVITWQDRPGTIKHIHLRRYDGSSGMWEEVGDGSAGGPGISDSSEDSLAPLIAMAADDAPVVLWSDGTSGLSLYLRRWNDTASTWDELGDSATGSGIVAIARNPALATDLLGDPYVAYSYGVVTTNIALRKWNPTTSLFGAIDTAPYASRVSNTSGHSFSPSLAVDSTGVPCVAWVESGSGVQNIFVRRWDASSSQWGELGGSGTGTGISNSTLRSQRPNVFVDSSDNPVVAWTEQTGATISETNIYVLQWNSLASAWQEVGMGSASGSGVSDSGSTQSATLAEASGALILLWNDGSSGSTQVYARQHDAVSDTWKEMGSGSASAGGLSQSSSISSSPHMAVDGLGRTVVVWQEQLAAADQIYALRYNPGTSIWESLPAATASGAGVSGSNGESTAASMVLDSQGNPFIAWQELIGEDPQIYVRRWQPSNGEWVEVGVGSATGDGVSQASRRAQMPSLALDSNDVPVVAWSDNSSNNTEIAIRRYDAGSDTWVNYGGASSPKITGDAGSSLSPSLALDADGVPTVAWTNAQSNRDSEIFVRRYNRATQDWESLGTGSDTGGGISNNAAHSYQPSLVLDGDGAPIVAWYDRGGNVEIYVRRFNSSTDDWEEVGVGSATQGGVSGTGHARMPVLAIDRAGVLTVAWEYSESSLTEIFVRQFNASTSTWDELGAGSASGTGISNAPGWTRSPALALTGEGTPIVAWQDDAEIQLRYHNPTTGWSELGSGSGTLSGISNSHNDSFMPTIAHRNGRTCVAWHEYGRHSSEIALRCSVAPVPAP